MVIRPITMLPHSGPSLRFEKAERKPLFSLTLHGFDFGSDTLEGIVGMVERYRKANRLPYEQTKQEVEGLLQSQYPQLFCEQKPADRGAPIPAWLKPHLEREDRDPTKYRMTQDPYDNMEADEERIKGDFRVGENGQYEDSL